MNQSPYATKYVVISGFTVEIVANNFKIRGKISKKQITQIKNYLISEGFTDNMPDWCIYTYTE